MEPTSIMRSAERVLNTLLALAQEVEQGRRQTSFSVIARKTGTARSTTHRALQLLAELGFVVQDEETKNYSLGPTVFWLSLQAQKAYPLLNVARPVMEDLNAQFGETVTLNVLQQDQRLCLGVVDGDSELRVVAEAGKTYPLSVGSSAKILMAFADADRRARLIAKLAKSGSVKDVEGFEEHLGMVARQGWVLTRGERVAGVVAISVPVWGHELDESVACLTVSMPSFRDNATIAKKVRTQLIAASAAISERLYQSTILEVS